MEKRIKAVIKQRYTQLAVWEEDLWRQRAKTKWEVEGDKNTRFFHMYASGSKAGNTIGGIEKEGHIHKDQRKKAEIFREFYMQLMGTAKEEDYCIDWDILYPNSNELSSMAQLITQEEIRKAIDSWPNNKAPGPDGYCGEFFKEFKDILIPDIHSVLSQAMQGDGTLFPLNNSIIALIPKSENSCKAKDFRPISLIGGVQKIISKLLANRLQEVIGDLVHQSQTGFLKGRQITEGFVYAQEVLHFTKENNIPVAIFKADIHKAFDTISWRFLSKVLLHLGFPEIWISWIMRLVLQGSSQIMINGLIGKKIELRRGVRQGDPLSPFLFILAMDFIPRWLQRLMEIGALRMPIEGMQPSLLYADDALFFIKPEFQQIQILRIVLTVFATISGLKVNMDKSELVATATTDSHITQLSSQIGCKKGSLPFKYLGLPLSDSRLQRQEFTHLIQKIRNRLTGWASKLLSIAGRVVLINSVITTMPIYYMSVFRMPKWVLQEIDQIRRTFLWQGVTQGQRKIHQAEWSLICRPKRLGGLGILEIENFNFALMAKWYWQWCSSEPRLWKGLFQTLYCAQNNLGVFQSYLFKGHLKQIPNFCWSFMESKQGRGDTIQMWDQNWALGILKYKFEVLYTFTIREEITLEEYTNTREMPLIFRSVLSETAAEQLQWMQNQREQYMTTRHQQEGSITGGDTVIWKNTANGKFTVKSAYNTLQDSPARRCNTTTIWKLHVPPRFKIFAWLLVQNKILTTDNLRKRGYNMAGICYMCRTSDETVQHLFNECTQTEVIYSQVLQGDTGYTATQDNLTMLVQNQVPKKYRELLLISHFVIWRERCCRIFKEKSKGIEELVHEVRMQWEQSAQSGSRRQQQVREV